MDPDLLFVLGGALAVLMVPAVISALIDGRTPRTPALVALAAGIMIYFSVTQKPGAYSISAYPDVLVQVIGRYIN